MRVPRRTGDAVNTLSSLRWPAVCARTGPGLAVTRRVRCGRGVPRLGATHSVERASEPGPGVRASRREAVLAGAAGTPHDQRHLRERAHRPSQCAAARLLDCGGGERSIIRSDISRVRYTSALQSPGPARDLQTGT